MMLEELVNRLPTVDGILGLTPPQLDSVLLQCIAQRATSTDQFATKYVFEDEIVGLYPIGIKATSQKSAAANAALMEAWQRLQTAGLIMQAPGQAARTMTLTDKGRRASVGSVSFKEITVRQMLHQDILHR